MAGIRMTGLISNMDTESIVTQLMEAQRTKVTKIENKKTKLEWTQDKWKDFNTKLYKLYNDEVSKMRFQSTYMTKKATSSNDSTVKVEATMNATNGNHSVIVKQLASAQYVTSGKLGDNTSASSKLVELKDTDGNVMFTAGKTVTIKSATSTVDLEVTDSTTISDFVNACKSAGINASFDTAQKRLFISSKESGEANKFSITAEGFSDSSVYQSRADIMTAVGYTGLSTENKTKVSEALDTLNSINLTDTDRKDTLVDEVMSGNLTSTDSVVNEQEKEFVEAALTLKKYMEEKAAKDAETKIVAQEKKNLIDNFQSGITNGSVTIYGESYYNSIVDAAVTYYKSNGETDVTTEDFTSETGKYHNVLKTYISNRVESDINKALGKVGLTEEEEKNEDFKNNIDNLKKYLSDKITTEKYSLIDKEKFYYNIKNVSNAEKNPTAANVNLGTGSNNIPAQDCIVEYNGAELTSKTNSISINGLNFTAVSESAKDSNNNYTATTISVENDVDSVYNMIKGFFKSYNSMLSEMNTAYYADSARGYDPLTDEEREAMTDDQIEKWETKIKNSLLRRDNTLGGIISGMKTALSGNVSVNGKTYSLSSFGIQTSSDYSEKGLLHIYGDSDDSTYSGKTDKLKTALQEDPDTIMKVFTTIMEDLRDTMSKKMEKTSLSSALTYYNDVDISKKIKNYETEISDWETKLESMENRYYSQFTAMEKALANLQSQSSALSGLLGTN